MVLNRLGLAVFVITLSLNTSSEAQPLPAPIAQPTTTSSNSGLPSREIMAVDLAQSGGVFTLSCIRPIVPLSAGSQSEHLFRVEFLSTGSDPESQLVKNVTARLSALTPADPTRTATLRELDFICGYHSAIVTSAPTTEANPQVSVAENAIADKASPVKLPPTDNTQFPGIPLCENVYTPPRQFTPDPPSTVPVDPAPPIPGTDPGVPPVVPQIDPCKCRYFDTQAPGGGRWRECPAPGAAVCSLGGQPTVKRFDICVPREIPTETWRECVQFQPYGFTEQWHTKPDSCVKDRSETLTEFANAACARQNPEQGCPDTTITLSMADTKTCKPGCQKICEQVELDKDLKFKISYLWCYNCEDENRKNQGAKSIPIKCKQAVREETTPGADPIDGYSMQNNCQTVKDAQGNPVFRNGERVCQGTCNYTTTRAGAPDNCGRTCTEVTHCGVNPPTPMDQDWPGLQQMINQRLQGILCGPVGPPPPPPPPPGLPVPVPSGL